MSDDTSYSSIKTLLGRTRRVDSWHLTDEVDVLTLLGGSRFDLRDVETSGREVVEISITCVLGVVELLVPAGTMVVLDGTSFLASAQSAVAHGSTAALPRLEVRATTLLGRVRVRSPRDGAESADPPVSVGEPTAVDAPAPAAEAPDAVPAELAS